MQADASSPWDANLASARQSLQGSLDVIFEAATEASGWASVIPIDEEIRRSIDRIRLETKRIMARQVQLEHSKVEKPS